MDMVLMVVTWFKLQGLAHSLAQNITMAGGGGSGGYNTSGKADIMDALLLPLAASTAEYPRVDLDAEQAHRFCVGQRQRDVSWPHGLVAVFGPDGAVGAQARSTTVACWPRSAVSTSDRGLPVQPGPCPGSLTVTISRPFSSSLLRAGFIPRSPRRAWRCAKRVPAGHASQKKENVDRHPRRSLKTTSAARLTPAPRKSEVALLTARIELLTGHFKTHKKDHHSRRGLLQMVNRRRSLLDYLKKDVERYKALIEKAGLRR